MAPSHIRAMAPAPPPLSLSLSIHIRTKKLRDTFLLTDLLSNWSLFWITWRYQWPWILIKATLYTVLGKDAFEITEIRVTKRNEAEGRKTWFLLTSFNTSRVWSVKVWIWKVCCNLGNRILRIIWLRRNSLYYFYKGGHESLIIQLDTTITIFKLIICLDKLLCLSH